MTGPGPSEETRRILSTHLDVNAFAADWVESMQRTLTAPQAPGRAARFRRDLAAAILGRTISPAEYEALTGEDFDAPEDLERWLRELWHHLYGDDPVSDAPGERDDLPGAR